MPTRKVLNHSGAVYKATPPTLGDEEATDLLVDALGNLRCTLEGAQTIVGQQGTQGFQGFQGSQGTQGIQGFQGATGAGTQGFQGFQGATGVGTQGNQGNQGAAGTGTQGNQGNAATQQGFQGFQGATGLGVPVPGAQNMTLISFDDGLGGYQWVAVAIV